MSDHNQNSIIFTKTDESPQAAMTSFLPIIRHFADAAGITIDTKDISLQGRVLAAFADHLDPDQQQSDDLSEIADIVHDKNANIIKLPNISSTDGQLSKTIAELQSKGYAIPDYPHNPQNEYEASIKQRYDDITGSVVNPVLRQGNAVRLIPEAVKEQSRKNPHAMGEWSSNSKTKIRYMDHGDFYDTEQSTTLDQSKAGKASIVFVSEDGQKQVLKSDINLEDGDIVDAAVMRREDLKSFLEDVRNEAEQENLLYSLHLKATMMKKTDGAIFGEAVQSFLAPVFEAYEDIFSDLGITPETGLTYLFDKIESLPEDQQLQIKSAIEDCLENQAKLAMAAQNVTHLHAPNNVIIDVSMANLARWGGEVMDKDGNYGDTLAVIPDSTFARMHETGVEFFKNNGAADPASMGTTIAVRLQAGGAQEYGSKDKTFVAPSDGHIEIIAEDGSVISKQTVKDNDIWRMCVTHDDAIQNWIELGITQSAQTGLEAIFWLDENRAHDAEIIKKLKASQSYNQSTTSILSPQDAMKVTLDRAFQGQDTLAITGNVIGDHITDYFPILEVASSSKMLSLVQLLDGGLVAETGSGGTAPGLLTGEGIIAGLFNDNHFVWDDLGEAFALVESFKHYATDHNNQRANILASTLEQAVKKFIEEQKSPSPKGLDTRQSQYYLATYWAHAMAEQTEDTELAGEFADLADQLDANETKILKELERDRGQPADAGGQYAPDEGKLNHVMRPSRTLNGLFMS